MDIEILNFFLTVAKEGSFSKAADALYVSQPSLSRQIKNLEDSLNAKLFERTSTGVTLTDKGKYFFGIAENTVKTLGQMKETLATDADCSLRIGLAETENVRLVARAVNMLKKDFPRVTVHISSGKFDDLHKKLDKGELDLCVFIEPIDIIKYKYLRMPGDITWGLFFLKDLPLAKKSAVSYEDLKDLPLIVTNQMGFENEFCGWSLDVFSRLKIVSTFNLMTNAVIFAEEGVGYLLAIDGVVKNDKLCFRPLDPPLITHSCITWTNDLPLKKPAETLLSYIKFIMETEHCGILDKPAD